LDGDLEGVRRLVRQNRGLLDAPQGEEDDCYTPLVAASSQGQVAVMGFLLDEGAEPNLGSSNTSESPLIAACFSGHVTGATLLLARGASASPCGDRGRTPLMSACSMGHTAVAKLLLDHSLAHLDHQEAAGGQTALHMACARPAVPTARLLLEAGADWGVGDKAGRTALEWLAGKGRECEALLEVSEPACACCHASKSQCLMAMSTPRYTPGLSWLVFTRPRSETSIFVCIYI
jgi:ankyrin repeat protein